MENYETETLYKETIIKFKRNDILKGDSFFVH